MHIEVVYALPHEQKVFKVTVPAGTTAIEAIEKSGVLQKYPAIDLKTNKLGVYSRLIKPDALVHDGERIEIYRPLIADPKEMRKRRAQKAKDEGRAK